MSLGKTFTKAKMFLFVFLNHFNDVSCASSTRRAASLQQNVLVSLYLTPGTKNLMSEERRETKNDTKSEILHFPCVPIV